MAVEGLELRLGLRSKFRGEESALRVQDSG